MESPSSLVQHGMSMQDELKWIKRDLERLEQHVARSAGDASEPERRAATGSAFSTSFFASTSVPSLNTAVSSSSIAAAYFLREVEKVENAKEESTASKGGGGEPGAPSAGKMEEPEATDCIICCGPGALQSLLPCGCDKPGSSNRFCALCLKKICRPRERDMMPESEIRICGPCPLCRAPFDLRTGKLGELWFSKPGERKTRYGKCTQCQEMRLIDEGDERCAHCATPGMMLHGYEVGDRRLSAYERALQYHRRYPDLSRCPPNTRQIDIRMHPEGYPVTSIFPEIRDAPEELLKEVYLEHLRRHGVNASDDVWAVPDRFGRKRRKPRANELRVPNYGSFWVGGSGQIEEWVPSKNSRLREAWNGDPAADYASRNLGTNRRANDARRRRSASTNGNANRRRSASLAGGRR